VGETVSEHRESGMCTGNLAARRRGVIPLATTTTSGSCDMGFLPTATAYRHISDNKTRALSRHWVSRHPEPGLRVLICRGGAVGELQGHVHSKANDMASIDPNTLHVTRLSAMEASVGEDLFVTSASSARVLPGATLLEKDVPSPTPNGVSRAFAR